MKMNEKRILTRRDEGFRFPQNHLIFRCVANQIRLAIFSCARKVTNCWVQLKHQSQRKKRISHHIFVSNNDRGSSFSISFLLFPYLLTLDSQNMKRKCKFLRQIGHIFLISRKFFPRDFFKNACVRVLLFSAWLFFFSFANEREPLIT